MIVTGLPSVQPRMAHGLDSKVHPDAAKDDLGAPPDDAQFEHRGTPFSEVSGAAVGLVSLQTGPLANDELLTRLEHGPRRDVQGGAAPLTDLVLILDRSEFDRASLKNLKVVLVEPDELILTPQVNQETRSPCELHEEFRFAPFFISRLPEDLHAPL